MRTKILIPSIVLGALTLTSCVSKKKYTQLESSYASLERNYKKSQVDLSACTTRVQSLEDIFQQYTKENLKQIAQAYGFTGYSKFKKNELAQWLKNHPRTKFGRYASPRKSCKPRLEKCFNISPKFLRQQYYAR